MLKNYTITTTAETESIVCTAAEGKELNIMSIVINGGADGGDIKLSFSTGFEMSFSVDSEDTIILDNKMNLVTGDTLAVTASASGMKVFVSAAELAV